MVNKQHHNRYLTKPLLVDVERILSLYLLRRMKKGEMNHRRQDVEGSQPI